MNKSDISSRLKTFLKSNFNTIDEAAPHLGTTGNTLRNSYLNGRSVPGPDLLSKLFEMGCDINWLLFGVSNSLSDQVLHLKAENYLLKKKILSIIHFVDSIKNELN